jgi:hypothetical protein
VRRRLPRPRRATVPPRDAQTPQARPRLHTHAHAQQCTFGKRTHTSKRRQQRCDEHDGGSVVLGTEEDAASDATKRESASCSAVRFMSTSVLSDSSSPVWALLNSPRPSAMRFGGSDVSMSHTDGLSRLLSSSVTQTSTPA